MKRKLKKKLLSFPVLYGNKEWKDEAVRMMVSGKDNHLWLKAAAAEDGWYCVYAYTVPDLMAERYEPAKAVFLNFEEKEWINYSFEEKRWTSSMIGYYLTKERDDYYSWSSEIVEDSSLGIIQKEMGGSMDTKAVRNISSWQDDIHKKNKPSYIEEYEREKKRWESKEALMESLFSLIGNVPKKFKTYSDKVAKSQQKPILIYGKKRQRKGQKVQDLYCTSCHTLKMIPYRFNQYNDWEKVKCPFCGTEASVVSEKDNGGLNECYTSIVQKIKGGIVMRMFRLQMGYHTDGTEHVNMHENRRLFLIKQSNGKFRTYQFEYRPDSFMGNPYGDPYWHDSINWWIKSWLYTDNLKGILKDTSYKYCSVDLYQEKCLEKEGMPANVFDYMRWYRRKPYLEFLVKMGCTRLVSDIVACPVSNTRLFNEKGKNPKELLQLPPDLMKRLLSENLSYLSLQSEMNKRRMMAEETGKSNVSSAEVEEYMRWKKLISSEYGSRLGIKAFDYLHGKVSAEKFLNYLLKQQEKIDLENPYMNFNFNEIRSYYADYLDMAEQTGQHLEDMYYLMPPDLYKAHERVDKIIKTGEIAKRAAYDKKMDEKIKEALFSNTVLQKFLSIHAYGLMFVVPRTAAEFRREGDLMHNCVGGNRYIEAQARGESLILFIRKENHPNRPFATFEWKDDQVSQVYLAHNATIGGNTQKFVDMAADAVHDYEKQIKKKLRKTTRRKVKKAAAA